MKSFLHRFESVIVLGPRFTWCHAVARSAAALVVASALAGAAIGCSAPPDDTAADEDPATPIASTAEALLTAGCSPTTCATWAGASCMACMQQYDTVELYQYFSNLPIIGALFSFSCTGLYTETATGPLSGSLCGQQCSGVGPEVCSTLAAGGCCP
jgi:hypothetical protein